MTNEMLAKVVDELPEDRVNQLIDFALFLRQEKRQESKTVEVEIEKSTPVLDRKSKNLIILSEMMDYQSVDDEDYVSDKVIDNTVDVIFHLTHQPEIFKTRRNSIHLQFELADRSYMELEVFENRVTCMIVPKRNYSEVIYPEVSLDEVAKINSLVKDFYSNV